MAAAYMFKANLAATVFCVETVHSCGSDIGMCSLNLIVRLAKEAGGAQLSGLFFGATFSVEGKPAGAQRAADFVNTTVASPCM